MLLASPGPRIYERLAWRRHTVQRCDPSRDFRPLHVLAPGNPRWGGREFLGRERPLSLASMTALWEAALPLRVGTALSRRCRQRRLSVQHATRDGSPGPEPSRVAAGTGHRGSMDECTARRFRDESRTICPRFARVLGQFSQFRPRASTLPAPGVFIPSAPNIP